MVLGDDAAYGGDGNWAKLSDIVAPNLGSREDDEASAVFVAGRYRRRERARVVGGDHSVESVAGASRSSRVLWGSSALDLSGDGEVEKVVQT